ncbi:MAG: hypothetical protein ACR2JV_09145 [Gaiellales bacterium]
MADDDETTASGGDEAAAAGDAGGQIDLTQLRVESLMLQVASELMSIGAGQLGMIPEMVNGGDAFQASLAIAGADALIATFLSALPEGTPIPQPVDDLRRALAELKLAFADAVQMGEGGEPGAAEQPEAAAPPPPKQEPPRPKIWTPGGDV